MQSRVRVLTSAATHQHVNPLTRVHDRPEHPRRDAIVVSYLDWATATTSARPEGHWMQLPVPGGRCVSHTAACLDDEHCARGELAVSCCSNCRSTDALCGPSQNVVMQDGLTLPGVVLCNATKPCSGFRFVNVTNTGAFLIQKHYVCEGVVNSSSVGSMPAPQCFEQD